MKVEGLDRAVVREAAARAVGEDRGPVDLTSFLCVPREIKARGRVVARQSGILAGLELARAVCGEVDDELRVESKYSDGEPFLCGDVVLEVVGAAAPILTAERSMLNFLGHLSGIATRTKAFVDAAAPYGVFILDTRKTLPGLRALQKYAVRCGGGVNHRMGLYDAVMLKDNHFAIAGRRSLAELMGLVRERARDVPVILEADTLEQVAEFVELNPDRILLDNMSLEEMREAVRLVGGRIPLEASGNMTLDRVPDVAATGVNFISVGELTHSVKAVDFSLECEVVGEILAGRGGDSRGS